MLNGVGLIVLALAGLANGMYTDGGVNAWRVAAYPVIALLVYLQVRWRPSPLEGWIVGGVALAAVPVGMIVSPQPPPHSLWESVSGLISFAVVVVLPWLAARSRRQQAELVLAGQREVEQLKREREHLSEQARARERARIATDVHDSLGHELALIALRAGALELSAELSPANREAAAQLRASAVTATDRLRATIGMLRQDDVPVDPADERVSVLVERAVAAGMTVRFDAAAVDQLPSLVDRAVYRVVQESLTNAARHAPGAPVEVRIERADAWVTVTVANPVTEPDSPTPGTGSGLTGLAERVRLLDGEFTAEPTGDGFTVTARFPLEAPR